MKPETTREELETLIANLTKQLGKALEAVAEMHVESVGMKLERERNSAIAALMAIEERYIDGCDTYEDWKFMGETARSFLLHNDQIHPRRA